MLLPRDKIRFRRLQVKVGVDKRVIRDTPERALVLGIVPQRFRAFLDRLFQHLERCIVLGLDRFLHSHVDSFPRIRARLCADLLMETGGRFHPSPHAPDKEHRFVELNAIRLLVALQMLKDGTLYSL